MRWILICVFCGLLASGAEAQTEPVRVIVDGVPLRLEAPPQLVNGRVMVPLRGVFERLGARVVYHASTEVVFARRPGISMNIGVGSPVAYVNRRSYALGTPSFLADDRVYIPLRFVAQAFGARVQWLPQDAEVSVWTGLFRPYPPNTLVLVSAAAAPARENATLIGGINFEPRLTTVGTLLTVQGTAAPGAGATVSMGDSPSLPMQEVSPGIYQVQHPVTEADAGRPIMHVRMPDGVEDGAESPVSIPVVGGDRPAPPVVLRADVNGTNSLHTGQRLVVSADATPGLTATFSLGRFIFPMVEESPGLYRGEYVVQPQDGVTEGRIMVSVVRADGERASLEAAQAVNFSSP